MAAAYVPLTIDQGEDFTAHVIWTDNYDEPQKLVPPARMDIKDSTGTTVLSLATADTELPDGEIPQLQLSTDIGLVQIHIQASATTALLPGTYGYDLFVATDDDTTDLWPQQYNRLIAGPVTVNKRVTQMT